MLEIGWDWFGGRKARGKNVVRYVPAGQAPFEHEPLAGHALFKRLAEKCADEVIKLTRWE